MRVISAVFLLLMGGLLSAQTSSQLKAKRADLLRDIQLTGKALESVRGKEQQTLAELLLLDQQVASRDQAVTLIGQELKTLEREIAELDTEALRSRQSKEAAWATYRRLARYRLYYRLSELSPILFILASPQWNIVFHRMYLFDRLAVRSKEAARAFREAEIRTLEIKREQEARRTEVKSLLDLEKNQKQKVVLEKQERTNLLHSLQSNQESLMAQQEKLTKERLKLEEAIANLIRSEIAAEEAKAKKRSPAKSKGSSGSKELSASPAITKATGDFARNKGKLGWPVERGAITRTFGPQQHPSLPRVRINNTGIDFRTADASPVHAVFDGEISGIQWVPGYANTMIIRHGKYYSVYSNMETVVGKKGDVVSAGTVVGTAAIQPVSGTAEIHFEIWKGKNREDPSQWLIKK
ncbi:MAG: peptidoglycan DD-metalloendopeptidase family protein [Saprospiraceae bacterium]|nr:peptidoglycan DD-metalloendopeptidase family protein [Saprospiraceae bacterium]